MTVPAESPEKMPCGECLLMALLWPFALILCIIAFGQEEPKQRWAKRIRLIRSLVSVTFYIVLIDMLACVFLAHRQVPLGYVFQGIITGVFTLFGFLIERFAQGTRNSQASQPMSPLAQYFFSIHSMIFWTGVLLGVLLGAQLGFPASAETLKIAFCGLAGLWLLVIPLINYTFSLSRRQRPRRARE